MYLWQTTSVLNGEQPMIDNRTARRHPKGHLTLAMGTEGKVMRAVFSRLRLVLNIITSCFSHPGETTVLSSRSGEILRHASTSGRETVGPNKKDATSRDSTRSTAKVLSWRRANPR